jgi:hypothetical protein
MTSFQIPKTETTPETASKIYNNRSMHVKKKHGYRRNGRRAKYENKKGGN